MKKLFLRLSILALTLALSLSVISAQDEAIEFEPFSDLAYELEGLIPSGWTAIGNGLYLEDPTNTSSSLLAFQAVPLDPDALLNALLPQLALTEAPESVGNYETEFLYFTLFQVDVDVAGVQVDLGLAYDDGRTVLALLQATPENYDELHETLYFQVLDALRPLVVEPVEVPYSVEEVTFENGDITLAGTLTIPEGEGPFPVVVLMSGSGQQDRDEMVVPGFRIFALIADALTREGVAVLRYDDRGVGKSTGVWTDASMDDFASDAMAGVAYLLTRDEISPDKIGLFGHSEGGVYAIINAAQPETDVDFIISMAGIGVSGQDVLLQQNRDILEQAGAPESIITSQLTLLENLFPELLARDYDALYDVVYQESIKQLEDLTPIELATLGDITAEEYATQSAQLFMQQSANEPFASLMEFDPTDYFDQITMPVLAIFGGLDIQVSAEHNALGFEEGLAHNDDLTIIIIDDANHLFQSAVTGSMEEYETLAFDFTPDFIPSILNWMREQGILE
jgi:pimeloyl-ACP methyl ester carboxylesterase